MSSNGGEMVWCPEGMSDISLLNEVAKRCSETNISPPLNKSEKQDWWAEGESFSGRSRSDFVQRLLLWDALRSMSKIWESEVQRANLIEAVVRTERSMSESATMGYRTFLSFFFYFIALHILFLLKQDFFFIF